MDGVCRFPVQKSSSPHTGQEKASWGSQTNPTFKIYSPQGQLTELRTFRSNDLALAPDETTANYDDTAWVYNERDQLVRKEYADGKGTDYTYTDAGRLLTRTWERGVVSTYGYDTAGALITTDYSDTTPDVAIVYDKIGRALITTQTNQSQIEYAYNPANLQLDTETIRYDVDHDGTFEFIRALDRSNDTLGRSTGFTLNNGTTMENSASYAYSASDGRLGTVADGTDSFSYLYVPNSSLVNSITGPVHTVTNSWENTRNVLLTKKNEVGSTVVSKYTYNANSIGQRTSLTTAFDLGGSHANNSGLTDWSYDSLGQLVSADAPGSTSDRGYLFDSIGNRRGIRNGAIGVPTETNGAITSGQGTELYSANLLNQYETIPQAPATPTYDDDGNMVTGPLPADPTLSSTLQWDAENRLIQTQVGTSGTLVKNLYDSQSRRIAKIVGTTTTLYVYDGWNCIAEYSGGTLSKTRLWGMDLSGSMQGAGGVGGMLVETQGSNSFYPTFDGNGNVSEYLYANGNVAAHFEYDPFGNTVVNTDASGNFEYRFSTKPLSAETGLYYYGYRYYDPATGRWPSRDPIGERGGVNRYGFVQNSPAMAVDLFGLDELLTGCGGHSLSWSTGKVQSARSLNLGIWAGHEREEFELKFSGDYQDCCKKCPNGKSARVKTGTFSVTGRAQFSFILGYGFHFDLGIASGTGILGIGGDAGGEITGSLSLEYDGCDESRTGSGEFAVTVGGKLGAAGYAAFQAFGKTFQAQVGLYGNISVSTKGGISCQGGNCSVDIGGGAVNAWASFDVEADLGWLGTYEYSKNLGGISANIDGFHLTDFTNPF